MHFGAKHKLFYKHFKPPKESTPLLPIDLHHARRRSGLLAARGQVHQHQGARRVRGSAARRNDVQLHGWWRALAKTW